MTIVRTRPLPPGRYWADIFASRRPQWAAWISVQQNAGNAAIETTEHFDGDESANLEERDFVIFKTTAETVWPDEDMHFAPNLAPPHIKSSADTIDLGVQEPDPFAKAAALGEQLVKGVVTVGAVAVGLITLFGLLSLAKRQRAGR